MLLFTVAPATILQSQVFERGIPLDYIVLLTARDNLEFNAQDIGLPVAAKPLCTQAG